MTQLVGLTSSTLVKSGDRLRATWTFLGSSWLPAWVNDAPQRAKDIQVRLPSLGFVPLTQPSALDGDEAIVFDIQVGTSWGSGVAVSTIVEKLDHVGTGLTAYYDMNLTRLEKIVATSSTDLQQQLDAARTQANADANANALFDKLGDILGIAGKTLAFAVVVAVAVGVYIYTKRK